MNRKRRYAGRPMKYRRFINVLDDGKIYTPAAIVRHGLKLGLFEISLKETELKEAMERVRHTFSRFSANHSFPLEGDGWVHFKGQAPMRGWLGRRWKASLPPE